MISWTSILWLAYVLTICLNYSRVDSLWLPEENEFLAEVVDVSYLTIYLTYDANTKWETAVTVMKCLTNKGRAADATPYVMINHRNNVRRALVTANKLYFSCSLFYFAGQKLTIQSGKQLISIQHAKSTIKNIFYQKMLTAIFLSTFLIWTNLLNIKH